MINTEKQHELLTFPNLSEDYSYVLEGFEENFKKLVAVAEEYPKTSVFSSYSLAFRIKYSFISLVTIIFTT